MSDATESSRLDVIKAVKSPLAFFVLALLCIEVVLGAVLMRSNDDAPYFLWVLAFFVGLCCFLVILVAYMAISHPDKLFGGESREKMNLDADRSVSDGVADLPPDDDSGELKRLEHSPAVAGDDQPPAEPNAWYDQLLPVLDEAVYYTTPTYFLDTNLRILDWNIAFQLIFERATANMRGLHVTKLIAKLDNFSQVMDHADKFTRAVLNNRIPYVDVEPIDYRTARYGLAKFAKVATQLHDAEGVARGWAVALLIQQIDWEPFLVDLDRQAKESKLWSVYASSYDRVLTEFPPYQQLIQDVISVVPRPDCQVADLGAGTGNVTQALLAGGHRVTAVEENPGMLARLRAKGLPPHRAHVVRTSVEYLQCLPAESYHAAVMVNVLYAVNDPLSCLHQVAGILEPGGLLAFSTTHSETHLTHLLNEIKGWLIESDRYDRLKTDYETVRKSNQQIEREIARRHTRDEYRQWVEQAGFEIIKDVPDTYEDAVMLIHARKR